MRLPILSLLLLPLAAQDAPRLLATPDDLARAQASAAAYPWARAAIDTIVTNARNWPQSHLTKYGLKSLELPPEGGQWTLWDVCPVHGVSLAYTPPGTKTCPVDGKRYSGWPYDQVTYDRRHSDLASAAQNLALAYRFTGDRQYAEAAAWILNQYGQRYLSYALHDKDNKTARSGARVHAQTLDEAVWLIPIAWAYDLLAGSDVLAPPDRARIEKDLLRAAVETIQRNDAGMSNWQSWHNGAIGAVGFTLADQPLIDAAIDGPSGFRFQMKQSVTGEGFWYEGAWGYHFYALEPLVDLAEMAARSGYDLWAEMPLRNMFTAPLYMVLPNGNLPAFNDSKEVSLYSYDRLYEVACARYAEPAFAAVLGTRTRGLNALLWGLPELPKVTFTDLASSSFPASGYTILRATQGDFTLAVKYGAHGGGHGHYDKPTFVTWFNGATQALDPGTQSYAAPTHTTWDLVTVAHNTVVVDEAVQAQSTGALLWDDLASPAYRAVRVSAGPAYKNAKLERTLFLTSEYAIDVFDVEATDGKPRTFDWVYHNDGRLSIDPAGEPYSGFGKVNGYQNLAEPRAAVTAGSWQAKFDSTPTAPTTYGSVYNSVATVKGTFQTVAGHAVASYEFNSAGYILYSTPQITGQPPAMPKTLSMQIYGDGSKHKLALRLYDSTDERFVATVGVIDWTGWKRLEVSDLSKWSHYLGNADGVFDLPAKQASLELTYVEGGPKTGALYVDDITLGYDDGAQFIAADFELPLHNMRLWALGAPDTTVVNGNGLGPDLLKPVPFVLARRSAKQTQFVTLMEPYKESPRITKFERDPDGLFRVQGDGWTDTFRLTPEGVRDYQRQ